MKIKLWSIMLLIIAFLGFLDSLYLTYQGPQFHLFEQLCTNSVCDDFSLKIFGIHISVYGIIYYMLLILFSLYVMRKTLIIVPLFISGIGFLFSLYFLYYQAFVIRGFCIFCIFSFICTLTYFLIVMFLYFRTRPKKA
jgi:uncharacterized membrane protein